MKKRIILLISGIAICLGILLYLQLKNKNNLQETNIKNKNGSLAIMIKENGASDYTKSSSDNIPICKYKLNEEKTNCENGGKISDYNSETGKIKMSLLGADKCYLYFDYAPNYLYSEIEQRYKNNDEFVKLYNPTEFGDATIYANNIYYFNGAVENNNVLFAGFCWKIVRTTETGGIKMIYNGVQTNDLWNNTGNAAILTKKSVYSSDITSLAYVGYMYNKVYTVSVKNMSNESNIIFGSTFTYSNGTYKINNTKTIVTWSSEYNTLNDKHYTCLTTSTTCSSLNYIFTANDGQIYYMTLTNGESIDNALKNMLYADDVNNKNSTIKENIDSWYKDNMTGYTDKLEDTVFCNDRTIKQGTWEATSNISSSTITISLGNSPGLACLNETDRFSMSNNKAKLTYPVGLLSSAEASLALKDSDKNQYYLAGSTAWLMSPQSYTCIQPYILASLLWSGYGVSILATRMSYGVRPVISLKPNTEYTLRDGSYTNPFVVE